jgi:hypothetical protein
MLTSVPTKYGSGITIYGDYYDLSALNETIHKIAGQNFVQENTGEFMLGLAYDARKAYEGQRVKRKLGLGSLDKVNYYGFSVLWPIVLTQAGMIRHFAAYHVTDRKDQACLYLLEDCILTSLLASDVKVGKGCAEWLIRFRIFPSDYLWSFITECTRRYLFDSAEKSRFSTLPQILKMLDWWSPEYKKFAAELNRVAQEKGCSPHELKEQTAWPRFRW